MQPAASMSYLWIQRTAVSLSFALVSASGCAERRDIGSQASALCDDDGCPPLEIINLPDGLIGPPGETTVNLTFDTNNPAQCIVLETPMDNLGPSTHSLDIWYSLGLGASFTYPIVCTDIAGQTVSTSITLVTSPAVVETIVAETMAGTMTMAEAIDLARAAGLEVAGDPGLFPFTLSLIDPGTSQTVLTVTQAAEIRPSNPPGDAVECEYDGVKFLFDGGRLAGLPPRAEGYRVVVHQDVPNGLSAAKAGCQPWNAVTGGHYQEPTQAATEPRRLLAEPFVYIRCMTAQEESEYRSTGVVPLGAEMTYRRGGFPAVNSSRILVDCKESHVQDVNGMASILQHECGHAIGVGHAPSAASPLGKIMTASPTSWQSVAAGPKPVSEAEAAVIRRAWEPNNRALATSCVKLRAPSFEPPLCETEGCGGGGDPCADPCAEGCPAAGTCDCNPTLPGCAGDPCSDACNPGCHDANTCACNPSFCTPCDVDPICCGEEACQCREYLHGVWDGTTCYECNLRGCFDCYYCLNDPDCFDRALCELYFYGCGCTL